MRDAAILVGLAFLAGMWSMHMVDCGNKIPAYVVSLVVIVTMHVLDDID